MKKTLGALVIMAALVATPALAMNVNDILELCNAGFEPDRIARIVEAAGMDQPLEAADWARLKNEGCGDQVVDALLDVLAPADVEVDVETESGRSYDVDGDVDINLYGSWGTNGWYGSLFWGGYDPWYGWGYRYAWYDPFWDWNWYWAGWNWYDPWWCSPHTWHYYRHVWHDPYYYCHGHYNGGYYSGGAYERQKASRQGGTSKAFRYANAKTSTAVAKATYASAKAKPYRNAAVATGMVTTGGVAVRKSTRTSVTTANGATLSRTKSGAYTRGSSTVGTGAVKREGTSSTIRTDNGYAKRKTSMRSGGATSTGNTTTVNRGKTKSRTSTGTSGTSTSTVKRKGTGATSTGKSGTGTGTKPSGSSYQAPSPAKTATPSFRSPGTTAAPRSAPSSGGTARSKGRR